jgi:hypothetical protein
MPPTVIFEEKAFILRLRANFCLVAVYARVTVVR